MDIYSHFAHRTENNYTRAFSLIKIEQKTAVAAQNIINEKRK